MSFLVKSIVSKTQHLQTLSIGASDSAR